MAPKMLDIFPTAKYRLLILCILVSYIKSFRLSRTKHKLGVKSKTLTHAIFTGMELIRACSLNKNYLNIPSHKPEQCQFDRLL